MYYTIQTTPFNTADSLTVRELLSEQKQTIDLTLVMTILYVRLYKTQFPSRPSYFKELIQGSSMLFPEEINGRLVTAN